MSDLQCAARVFVAAYADEATSRQLASLLSGERIARVWATAGEQAVESAGVTAGVLGVEVVVREDLPDLLGEVADTHRGEGVLVVSARDVILETVPLLSRNLTFSRASELSLREGDVIALESDADGWVARTWAGETFAE